MNEYFTKQSKSLLMYPRLSLHFVQILITNWFFFWPWRLIKIWIQDGHIGSDLVIRPLPERVLNEVVSKVQELHEPHLLPNVTRTKRSLKHTSHHVVYRRINRPIEDEFSDFGEFYLDSYPLLEFWTGVKVDCSSYSFTWKWKRIKKFVKLCSAFLIGGQCERTLYSKSSSRGVNYFTVCRCVKSMHEKKNALFKYTFSIPCEWLER